MITDLKKRHRVEFWFLFVLWFLNKSEFAFIKFATAKYKIMTAAVF